MANYSELDPLALRFQQPDLRRLLDRLADRLRKGQPLAGRLRITNPHPQEQQAIVALLGSRYCRPCGQSLSVDLAAIEILATRDGRFSSLRDLVESACGRVIENQRARRFAEEATWNELWDLVSSKCCSSEPLRRWIDRFRSSGTIRRRFSGNPAAARQQFDEIFSVLNRLPLVPPMSLSRLAAEVFGDSHALDIDRYCGRIVARGAAVLAGHDRPRSAAAVRAAWLSMGVVPDELSSTVLVLNLPADNDSPLGQVLALHRLHGEPCRITFRQLRGADCKFGSDAGKSIFVCENPSVVAAAADRWGAGCRPLICVEGQPNLAAEHLLGAAHNQDFSLHYHGDFDWGGVRIANRIWQRYRFVPWRFESQFYLEAPIGSRLLGVPCDTAWDPPLRQLMECRGFAVHEEAILGDLLDDLQM